MVQVIRDIVYLVVLSIPMVFSQILPFAQNVFSVYLISSSGNKLELGALGIAFSFTVITTIVGVGVSCLVDTLVSEANGAKGYKLAPKILFRVFVMVSLVSIILTGVMLLSFVYFKMVTSAAIADLAYKYCALAAISLYPHELALLFSFYLQAQEVSWIPTIAHVISVTISLPLTYVFIVVFKWGIVGASVAAILHRSMLAVLLAVATWIVNRSRGMPFMIRSMDWSIFKSYLEMAMPSCIWIVSDFVGYELMTMLAALLVAVSFSSIGVGITIRVANTLGANQIERSKSIGFFALITVLMISACSVGSLYVFYDSILDKFTKDVAIRNLVKHAAPFAMLAIVLDACSGSLSGILRGMGRYNVVFGVVVLSNVIAMGTCIVLIVTIFRKNEVGALTILWVFFNVSHALATVMYIVILYYTNWQQQYMETIKRIEEEKSDGDAEAAELDSEKTI